MKHLFAIFGIITVASIALLFVGCREVDTSKVDFTHDVSAHLGRTSLAIDPHDPVLSDLARWAKTSEPRWRRSITTYAPKLLVRNAHYSLNFIDGLAVLNFQPDPAKSKWIQIEREYNENELQVIEHLCTKIKQAEQADAGNRAKPGA